jgi:hypothetical protein
MNMKLAKTLLGVLTLPSLMACTTLPAGSMHPGGPLVISSSVPSPRTPVLMTPV